MGLCVGATVSFQDPKQTYEMKGCGGECASVRLCVCDCVCVCKTRCSILKLDFKLFIKHGLHVL